MTMIYVKALEEAQQVLAAALERYAAESRQSLQAMPDLRRARIGELCTGQPLEGQQLVDAVRDLWQTVEEDQLVTDRVAWADTFREALVEGGAIL